MSTVTTRAGDVYQRMRADILSGRIQPGERLPFAKLGQRYDASVGVLREALQRLAEKGLVVSEPQIGFHVLPVSVDDLRQLTEARVEIEVMVLRRSIEHGDVSWESRLLAAHHTLAHTPIQCEDGQAPVSEPWQAAHATYHETLLEACPNARLRGIASSLREASELYRCWSRGLQPGGNDGRDVAAEHQRILEESLARDVDRAVAELSRHIELSTELLIAAAQAPASTTP